MWFAGYKQVEWLDVPVAKNRTGTKRVKGLFPHSVHHTREIYRRAYSKESDQWKGQIN